MFSLLGCIPRSSEGRGFGFIKEGNARDRREEEREERQKERRTGEREGKNEGPGTVLWSQIEESRVSQRSLDFICTLQQISEGF